MEELQLKEKTLNGKTRFVFPSETLEERPIKQMKKGKYSFR